MSNLPSDPLSDNPSESSESTQPDFPIVPMTLDTAYVHCAECGVIIVMPKLIVAKRLHDGRPFYCWNGHESHFNPRNTAKAVAVADRDALRRKVLEIHELEQAEARLGDKRRRKGG